MAVTLPPPASNDKVRHHRIQDHEGRPVEIVWYLNSANTSFTEQPPPFPFQVYVTKHASAVAVDPEFPSKLIRFVENKDGVGARREACMHEGFKIKCRYRLDVYLGPFPNILACIAHQRREIAYRNRNAIVPRPIASWSRGITGYNGKILIVDDVNWQDVGLTVAVFDELKYEQRPRCYDWARADGDMPVVRTFTSRVLESLSWPLAAWWTQAGGSFIEADLQRKNDAGSRYASPALYPAFDPSSHDDLEDVTELNGAPSAMPTSREDGESVVSALHAEFIDTFDLQEIFHPAEYLEHISSDAYNNHLGLMVTSAWDPRLSRTRPEFVVTLYTASDLLSFHPKALFNCLNKGMLADEAWTLDVAQNIAGLETAFQHQEHASKWRNADQTSRRQAYASMIVGKVAGCRLPVELLDSIADMVVPPMVPKYGRKPHRPFTEFFLYLDKAHLHTGPLTVYSNFLPTVSYGSNDGTLTELSLDQDWGGLQVMFLRYWHRVSNEIHILWSCYTPTTAAQNAVALPKWSLKLNLEDTRPDTDFELFDAFTLQTDGAPRPNFSVPVRPHTHLLAEHPIVALDLDAQLSLSFRDYFCIKDIDTGEFIPLPWTPDPFRSDQGNLESRGWQMTRELAYKKCDGPDKHLKVGTTCHLMSEKIWASWWCCDLPRRLRNGGRYAVRLQPAAMVPMWTYGTPGALEGPYNLPPLPLTMDEPVEFQYFAPTKTTLGRFQPFHR